jgi:uncharacterized membrane protein YozB (DUF420 family)
MSTAILQRVAQFGPASGRRSDRIFYSCLIVALVGMIVVGSGSNYYFRLFSDPPVFTRLVALHVASCNAWLALLLAQTTLISAGQGHVHRWLGMLGAFIAAAFVVLAYLASIDSVRRGFHPVPGPPANVFFAILLRGVLVFAAVIGAALYFRRDPETHKRLILIGTIAALLPATVGRLAGEHQWINALVTLMFLAASPLYDKWSRGRVHPVNRWTPWVVFATSPLSALVGTTAMWDSIIAWLAA